MKSIRQGRPTIAGLMMVVLLVAIASAALFHPTESLASTLYTLTTALLCWSACMAMLNRDHRRAFWAGFAIFGWVHLVFFFGPLASGRTPPPRLLYENWISILGAQLRAPEFTFSGVIGDLTPTYFRQIGLTLSTLLVALIGGILALFAGRKATEPPANG